jgi:hypothetical protein
MSAPGTTSRRDVLLGAGRGALAVAVAGAVGACTSADEEPTPPPAPDPDDALREATAERERALLGLYDAVLLAAPELAARLAPLRVHHEVHLAELVGREAVGPSPTSSAAAAASPSPSPSPSALPVLPPGDPLAVLVEAERTAGAAHATDALAARDSTLAALLASLSASEQSHPVALA